MANLAIAPVVNAKLYRYFAAVTFAITLCVALFANGEARQVVEDGVADQQQTVKLKKAEVKKFGVTKIGDNRSKRGSFGNDYDPSYGASSDFGGSRPDTFAGGREVRSGIAVGPRAIAAPIEILSPDEMAQLSPAEQEAYLKKLRSQGAAPHEEEAHDLAAIEAGSRARSGGDGSGD